MLPDYRVRQRDFLLEISRAITAQLDLGEVLKRVLNASVVMLGGQAGWIALRDPRVGYRIRATVGLDSAKVPELNQKLRELIVGVEEGHAHEVAESTMKAMLGMLDTSGQLRQYVALPLIFAGEPLGLLVIFRSFPGSATSDDVQILQSFADQAAIAVHNAQLYEHIDHERRRLGAILQHNADGVMILDANRRVLMFNRALERMTGWRSADAVGQLHDDVIQWKRREGSDLNDALASGWPKRRDSDTPETLYAEGDLQRRDGMTLSVGITYAPLFTSEGQLANVVANVRDITHWRQAQEMQNVFISTISHELKTPVAIIKGYAGTLTREDANWNPETIKQGLEVIEDEADRLTALIENLLTASRLQADRAMRLDMADVRLDELAARAVERLKSQSAKHKFALDFPSDFPPVQGDETRLRQVIDNLLGNAIKYSPEGGKIEVGGVDRGSDVVVYVRDQGVGLTEADQEHVFDRFYRVDSALSRKTQGTGLGLYLAKSIVEAHGGTIGVDSKPGQGSTFYFTIPLDRE
jgi:PAS domain S-box-containing protein